MYNNKQKDTKMSTELSLRERLSNLNEKLGYARIVKGRLEDKGIIVNERHIYLVVNGVKRRYAEDILLEVDIYVSQREEHKRNINKQRKELQVT